MSIDIPFTLNTMLSSNEDTSSYEDYHSILEQYLNQFRIDKSDKTTKYTHTGMLYPRGSFHIPDECFDTFIK